MSTQPTEADIQIAQIADQIVGRQAEIDAYSMNIATYSEILGTGDGEWPDSLAHLRGMDAHLAAFECPINQVETLATLQGWDRANMLIRTEMLERTKVTQIKTALETALLAACGSQAAADAAVADAQARRIALLNPPA